MQVIAVVIFVLLTIMLVPYIKRIEQNKAMESEFMEAWSKELGKKKSPKLLEVVSWLLISSVAIMVASLFINFLF